MWARTALPSTQRGVCTSATAATPFAASTSMAARAPWQAGVSSRAAPTAWVATRASDPAWFSRGRTVDASGRVTTIAGVAGQAGLRLGNDARFSGINAIASAGVGQLLLTTGTEQSVLAFERQP